DVLEVVVLAPRAHALLAGRGAHVRAALVPQEHGLELHHARVGEEQGRIVAGYERRGAHAGVAVALEELQKRLAELGAGHWKANCSIATYSSTGRPTHSRTTRTTSGAAKPRRRRWSRRRAAARARSPRESAGSRRRAAARARSSSPSSLAPASAASTSDAATPRARSPAPRRAGPEPPGARGGARGPGA